MKNCTRRKIKTHRYAGQSDEYRVPWHHLFNDEEKGTLKEAVESDNKRQENELNNCNFQVFNPKSPVL